MGLSLGGAIRSIGNTITHPFDNPIKSIATIGGAAALGPAGYVVGDRVGNSMSQMPAQPTFEGLNGAQTLQGNIIGARLAAAKRFSDNLPDYIEGQYGSQKAGIDRSYDQQKKSLAGDLNSRGMFKSGEARLQKGQLAADRAAALTNARGNVVKDAYNQASAYETDPLFSLANVQEANTRQQSALDQLTAQRQAAANAIMGSAAQQIGSGVGKGTANLNAGKSFTYGGT